jgi:hypothetical protein
MEYGVQPGVFENKKSQKVKEQCGSLVWESIQAVRQSHPLGRKENETENLSMVIMGRDLD